MKRVQSITYLFRAESEVFIRKDNFNQCFEIAGTSHPDILKKYLQKVISLETMVILDNILEYSKKFDKKLVDPVWESVSLRIKKYRPFINNDDQKYTKILKELVL